MKMDAMKKEEPRVKIATKAAQGGGGIAPPLHLGTIAAQAAPGEIGLFEYGRFDNPTRRLVEEEIAALEGGRHGLLFASGMAAITAVLSLLASGDQVLCSRHVYDGTRRALERVFRKFGIGIGYFHDEEEAARLLGEETGARTRIVWLESISNPQLIVADVAKMRRLIGLIGEDGQDRAETLLVVDATMATPILHRPLAEGADIVVHSTTKFLGGHNDTTGGAVVIDDDALHGRLLDIQRSCGAVPGPFDCFLLQRGLRTLAVRMERQCANARIIADHLRRSRAAIEVRQAGAIVTAKLREDPAQALPRLRLIRTAQSFGGTSTTIQAPRLMMELDEAEAERLGVTRNTVRISVGLEDAEDLCDDLTEALGAVIE